MFTNILRATNPAQYMFEACYCPLYRTMFTRTRHSLKLLHSQRQCSLLSAISDYVHYLSPLQFLEPLEFLKVIVRYIGLCSQEDIKICMTRNTKFVIVRYIGLCSQQYLLLFFFSFYHFSPKSQAFCLKKWGSRFSCNLKQSSIYAYLRVFSCFSITLLSADPLFK